MYWALNRPLTGSTYTEAHLQSLAFHPPLAPTASATRIVVGPDLLLASGQEVVKKPTWHTELSTGPLFGSTYASSHERPTKGMCTYASSFNSDLSLWQVNKVTDMSYICLFGLQYFTRTFATGETSFLLALHSTVYMVASFKLLLTMWGKSGEVFPNTTFCACDCNSTG